MEETLIDFSITHEERIISYSIIGYSIGEDDVTYSIYTSEPHDPEVLRGSFRNSSGGLLEALRALNEIINEDHESTM